MSALLAVAAALTRGDLEAARAAVDRARAERPGDAEVVEAHARVLLAEKRPADALAELGTLGATAGDGAELLRLEALLSLGRHEEAARGAEALLTQRPGLARARVALGRALYYAGDRLRALREVRRAVELAPQDPDARSRLGGMLAAAGRVREALAECEAAVRMDPRSAEARQNLAAALLMDGRHADAADALAPLASLPSLDPDAAAAALEVLEQVYAVEKQPRVYALVESIRARHGGGRARAPVAGRPLRARRSVLATEGRDLVELCRTGALGAVWGRDVEVDAVIDVLLRKKKSNPLLVGPAGVGKTAVVEALARRLAEGRVPERLRGARVVELSVASLVAGSAFRGELEEKLEALVEELRAARGTILFLDEVHTLVGAGALGGGLDVSEVLKPALARGEISVIGATTHEGYETRIARDAALSRRFALVAVREPAGDDALAILRQVATELEGFHGVRYEPECVPAALALSDRHLPDRRQPDKGVDVLDQSAVRAVRDGRRAVRGDDVRAVVASLARVDLPGGVGAGAGAGLLGLAARLRAEVFGQDEACERVAEVLLLRSLGLGEEPSGRDAGVRPRGVFVFAGPPGVGKSALARALAAALRGAGHGGGGGGELVRFDLGEMVERHEVARLLGSPAGYAGHEEGGALVRALRAAPDAVVLLEEAGKAHPDVLNVFLRLFDEGRVSDGRGEQADARHAVFVTTVTTGGRAGGRVGFAAEHAGGEARARAALREVLPEELVSRADAVLWFEPLGRDALGAVARRGIERARAALAREGAGLAVDDDAVDALVERALRDGGGARGLARSVEREVLVPAARALLAAGGAASLRVRREGDGVWVERG